jgi:hypothetical protein
MQKSCSFAALFLFLACTPTGTNPGTGATGALTADTYCAKLRVAQCAYRVRCGIADAQATCEAREASYHGEPNCAPLVASVKAARVNFDATAAQKCIDTYTSTIACDRETLVKEDASCVTATAGKVADDGACYNSVECGASSYCDASAMTCPGKCLAKKGDGATAASQQECVAGLYYSYNDKKCLAKKAADAACMADQECGDGLACVNMKCTAFVAMGGACVMGNACAGVSKCISGTCGPAPKRGDACLSDCPMDLSCTGDTAKTCIVPGDTGAACASSGDCAVGLWCKAKVCTAATAAGAACTDFSECAKGLYCNQTGSMPGTCDALGKEGATCKATGLGCDLGFACDTAAAMPTCKKYGCTDGM